MKIKKTTTLKSTGYRLTIVDCWLMIGTPDHRQTREQHQSSFPMIDDQPSIVNQHSSVNRG